MLISVGVGIATLILSITSFFLSIFAGLILGAKGVLGVISIVILLVFRFKHEREEEEHRRAAAAEEARKERERQRQI